MRVGGPHFDGRVGRGAQVGVCLLLAVLAVIGWCGENSALSALGFSVTALGFIVVVASHPRPWRGLANTVGAVSSVSLVLLAGVGLPVLSVWLGKTDGGLSDLGTLGAIVSAGAAAAGLVETHERAVQEASRSHTE